jgi:NADH:ubiquinone oxidoreductase subunit 5 (subunit L)/multisubunit Na+/H+ antiporter MnhA subunit
MGFPVEQESDLEKGMKRLRQVIGFVVAVFVIGILVIVGFEVDKSFFAAFPSISNLPSGAIAAITSVETWGPYSLGLLLLILIAIPIGILVRRLLGSNKEPESYIEQ